MIRRLVRIELTVADLDSAERFYTQALGFTLVERGPVDPALASLLAAASIRQVLLRRGAQTLALHAFEPPGAPYPPEARACDQSFQHFALPVPDMAQAMDRLRPFAPEAISHGGPQHLPQRSGGATAFKFRDPDRHPLELIRFPDPSTGGIDHSAIVVADAERSIAFYRSLGLVLAARQRNTGPEQDRLDGLPDVSVEVLALHPADATPHVELLAYRTPPVRPALPAQPADIAATRLVLQVDTLPDPATRLANGARAALTRDPDGHLLLLAQPPS